MGSRFVLKSVSKELFQTSYPSLSYQRPETIDKNSYLNQKFDDTKKGIRINNNS